MSDFKVGQHVKVKLSGGRLVDAEIKAVIETTEGKRLQVSFGEETAQIYLWASGAEVGIGQEKKQMTACYRAVLSVFIMCLGSLTLAQTKPLQEALKVKVIKIERVWEQDHNLYRIDLTFRDTDGRLYRVWNHCVSNNPDSSSSCGNVAVPRVGGSYDVTNYGNVTVQFAGDKPFYEIASIETADCK